MMKAFVILTLGFMSAFGYANTTLNYQQAHLFRAASFERADHYILNGRRANDWNQKDSLIFLDIGATRNDQAGSLIKALNKSASARGNSVRDELDKNQGKVADAFAKVAFGGSEKNFTLSAQFNSGGYAQIDNTPNPGMNFLYYQDFGINSSYRFFGENWSLRPRFYAAKRRVANEYVPYGSDPFLYCANCAYPNYTPFNDRPMSTVLEGGFDAYLKLKYLNLFAAANALPLGNNQFSYWDSELGVQTKNVERSWVKANLSLSYAPWYAGQKIYSQANTLKVVQSALWGNRFATDLFYWDKAFGGKARLRWGSVHLAFFTLAHQTQVATHPTSRQYGAELSLFLE